MNKLYTLIVVFAIFTFANFTYSQNISMTNTTINQCSGTLLDPGGVANYPNNSNTTTTICPLVAGASVRLSFSFFNTEAIFDNLTIYDGNSILAPVIGVFSGIQGPFVVQANNPTGCITLVFTSDANFTSLGFSAEISCALPCQTVIAQATSTTPNSVAGFIDMCVGSTLTANGNGNYPASGTVYPQSDASSTFRWDFGDLTSSTIKNTSHQYNVAGIFDLNLTVTDINGCKNTNDINLKVRVSDIPKFNGTSAANNTICLGLTNDLSGFAVSNELEYFCESSNPQDVVIPDGIGAPYSTTLNLDCFNPGATFTSASDISSICLDIEHSYLHDLEISLTCPNGTTISLYNPLPGALNSVNLGEPVDNDLSATFGTPYNYCFNMTAANTWYAVAEGFAGPVPTYTYIDNDGTPVIGAMYIPAGDYLPTQSFANFIGCPLNGAWTITITDQLASDNGVVFDISMDFNPSLYNPANNYTPSLASNWLPDPTISNTAGNTITITPTSVGNKCFVYRAIDEFGCQYDTTICFDVYPSDNGTFNYGQNTYCTSDPNPTPIISGTMGGVFNATNGLVINPLNGTIDLSVATAGTYDITYLTPGPGCPVTTLKTITINSATASFIAVNLTGCTPLLTTFTNTSPNSINCLWNFGDGNSINGCGPLNHQFTIAGNYSPELTITDNNGCQATDIQFNIIQVDAKPVASFIANPESIPSNNQTVILNNTSTGAASYMWVFANHTNSTATSPALNLNLNEDEEFLVKLYAFSAAGCIDSTQRYLRVTPELIFYIPNSFTPNHDEFNTYFNPIMTQGFKTDSYNFRIFNRWGNLVFHSQDINVGWDGSFGNSNRVVEDGIYTYQIDFLLNTGDERRVFHGHVNLIR